MITFPINSCAWFLAFIPGFIQCFKSEAIRTALRYRVRHIEARKRWGTPLALGIVGAVIAVSIVRALKQRMIISKIWEELLIIVRVRPIWVATIVGLLITNRTFESADIWLWIIPHWERRSQLFYCKLIAFTGLTILSKLVLTTVVVTNCHAPLSHWSLKHVYITTMATLCALKHIWEVVAWWALIALESRVILICSTK